MTRIYVDVDDVLCRTAEALLGVLEARTGRRASMADWVHFDPGRAFGLTAEQLEDFMAAAHEPSLLEELLPVEGAAGVLRTWSGAGCRLELMTGRPPAARDATLRWLGRNGVPFHALTIVDKYARHPGDPGAVALETLTGAGFDLAIEDSLAMAAFLARHASDRVLLVDRPWNREEALLGELDPASRRRITRVGGWDEIGRAAR